jgi:PHP family Zn ribbon phosphoesterase
MKIKNLLLISLISLFGCKNENKKDILPTVSKVDTVVKKISASKNEINIDKNKKVVIDGIIYYKKNREDKPSTGPCGQDEPSKTIYFDTSKKNYYDITTNEIINVPLELGEPCLGKEEYEEYKKNHSK